MLTFENWFAKEIENMQRAHQEIKNAFAAGNLREPWIKKTPGWDFEARSNFEKWQIKIEYNPQLYPKMKLARLDFDHPTKPLEGAEKDPASKSLALFSKLRSIAKTLKDLGWKVTMRGSDDRRNKIYQRAFT